MECGEKTHESKDVRMSKDAEFMFLEYEMLGFSHGYLFSFVHS